MTNKKELSQSMKKIDISKINERINKIKEKLLQQINTPLNSTEEQCLVQIDDLEAETDSLKSKINSEIMLFKEARNKEEAIMKQFKDKFSETRVKQDIIPVFEKFRTIEAQLKNYRRNVDDLMDEKFKG